MSNYKGAQYVNRVNTNVNFGFSTRLPYDQCAYDDRVTESVGPLEYRLNPNRIYNCEGCLSTLGPRSSYMGYGVSMPVGNEVAVSQAPELVNIESILTNRNVPTSKCRRNELNPINVTKIQVKNPSICNEYLNPMSSRLSFPAANYREIGLNRFYDLNKNPQANIFYNYAINSTLEAKDNFIPTIPRIWSKKPSLPHPLEGYPVPQQMAHQPDDQVLITTPVAEPDFDFDL